MNKLKRYNVGEFDEGDGYMCSYTDESNHGDWVKSEDVEKLEAMVAELEARCKTWEKRALRYANDAYSDDEVEAIKLMWEFQDKEVIE